MVVGDDVILFCECLPFRWLWLRVLLLLAGRCGRGRFVLRVVFVNVQIALLVLVHHGRRAVIVQTLRHQMQRERIPIACRFLDLCSLILRGQPMDTMWWKENIIG